MKLEENLFFRRSITSNCFVSSFILEVKKFIYEKVVFMKFKQKKCTRFSNLV